MKYTQTFQAAKAKKASGLPLLIRLDLSKSARGDHHAIQLASSSYLKDLKYLNLRDCRLSQKGFNEILNSLHLRSLETLVVRKNKIREIEGPFQDLEDLDEKQAKKGIMKLKLLDIRENNLTTIFQSKAMNFIKETVVLMWDNPFEAKGTLCFEFFNPASLFRAHQEFDDDHTNIQNPLHIF